jgi:dTDP-glucose 4,6-dehydratase
MKGRVLITGGAGFLGSHLCDRSLEEGFEVICLDSLVTGERANVRHLIDHPRFTFVQGDVTKPIEIEGPIKYVLHFASPASPKDYTHHPIHTLKVGALGTYHALGLAKDKGAVILLASSSEVYGDPQVSPQPEGYWGHVNPVGPRSVYDEAKRYAEAITMAYHRTHGVPIRIARIFNTYGPRMRVEDGRALPNFMTQALRGEPLTVYGDGMQTRSFCHVSDLIEGLFRFLTVDPSMNGHSDDPILNMGNPEEVTILRLAREIIRATNSSSTILFTPLPLDDPRVRRPDISRARRVLGWQPTVSLAEGLRLAMPYFSSALAKSGKGRSA